MNQKKSVICYLILSAIGAVLLVVASAFGTSDINSTHMSDKLIVGGAFIISCVFGIYAVIGPNLINKLKIRDYDRLQPPVKMMEVHGHHPDCEPFESHTLKIRNRILCTGCTGLALGSVLSIGLMGVYLVFPVEIQPGNLFIPLFAMVLVALNYLEMVMPARNAYLHLISNVFLVLSFFIVVAGIFHLTGSAMYGLFAVLISYLWLDTRVQLSDWRHLRICQNCSESCKVNGA